MNRHHRRGPLMQFERKHEPLLPFGDFVHRVERSMATGLVIVAGSLGIGVLGYHWSGRLGWLDSLYNASMILGGMGPVDDRGLGVPAAEKWFASFYALYSGLTLLVVVGVMFTPIFHRFMHHFHLIEEDTGKGER
jgi:hypothetical protein